MPERTEAAAPAEERPPRDDRTRADGAMRLRSLARLTARTFRSSGRAYPELARYLAGDTRRFLASRVRLDGAWVLDLGSGHGESGHALETAGARAISLDRRPLGGSRRVVGDASALPFRDAAFDGAVCANLLEHVPSPAGVVRELARVTRPGGWVYLSWTAWYGPFGGHEFSPWHYLGVRSARALGRHVRLGPVRNVPGRNLFPVHVGATLRGIERMGAFRILYAGPRYWPTQSWIVRVPGLREVATWNCLLLLERATAPSSPGRA
jgi:SAM-dependent methyltransferase